MTTEPWVEHLQNPMTAQSRFEASVKGIKQLGDLRRVLRTLPDDCPVVVDRDPHDESKTFLSPVSLESYRGYYERLSFDTHAWDFSKDEEPYDADPYTVTELIGTESAHVTEIGGRRYEYECGCSEVRIAQPATVAELTKAIDLADGRKFEGYKGGAFLMNEGTFLHVAPSGSSGTAVMGFSLNEAYGLVIETEEEEW